jgi:L-arabinose isomerase
VNPTDEAQYPGGLKVGFFAIGLRAYWAQYAGLQDRLIGSAARIVDRLRSHGAAVVDVGLIDTPEKAAMAGHEFRQADVDVIFLYASTYALSSTVLPVVRRGKVPVVILNLAPAAAIDYQAFNQLPTRTRMTGEWLAWCGACPVPEIANVLKRCGIPFFQVSGHLDDDSAAWAQIEDWLAAARVVQVMEHNRLGVLGNYYSGMLDVYSDFTQQCAYFGGHIEILEVDELAALRREVTETQIQQRTAQILATMDVQVDATSKELIGAAATSVALDHLVARHDLGALAYYHKGTGVSDNEEVMRTVILGTSLLTARGVPVAGEYEIKNAQAMKIMDTLGAGGAFTEYYAVDYADDVILMGHDGPGHLAIAEGKIKVRSLEEYHGKVAHGLSVEMSVKLGPITLLAVVQTRNGELALLTAEGESVAGPILRIGNTNSRYRFPLRAGDFMNQWNSHGPAHHWALGVGHVSGTIKKVASLLGMPWIRVC